MNPGGIVLLNMCLNMRMVSKMEDKVYEVDSVYPRVAALLRRAYAGEIWLDVLLEKCTSEVPTGIINQFEQVLKDLEQDCTNDELVFVLQYRLGLVKNVLQD